MGYRCITPLAILCLARRLRSVRIILDADCQERISPLPNGNISDSQVTNIVLCPDLDTLVLDGSSAYDAPRSCHRPVFPTRALLRLEPNDTLAGSRHAQPEVS